MNTSNTTRKAEARPAEVVAQHSPLPSEHGVPLNEALIAISRDKLLALRERDAIDFANLQTKYESLLNAYKETRTIEDKLRNELDGAHNDTFKARANAQGLADALKRIAYEPQGGATANHADVLRAVEHIAREAIAQWEQAQ